MLLASKVAKKNLIKNFLDADWFADYTSGGGTVSVDPVNPHKMTLNMSVSAQGRLIWVPVEIGKTYTFSFKQITGLYRIYKRKVGNHDANMVLTQDQNAGKPDTFSFTVDDTYKGFITIRLTFGSAGAFTFENLQLEVGSKTTFEPYTLVNPNASVPPVAVMNPKKNIYNKVANAFELGSIASATGLDSSANYVMRSKGYIAVKPNTVYSFIKPAQYNQIAPYPYDSKNSYLGNTLRPVITIDGVRCKFTTPSNCYFIRWQFNSPDQNYVMSQSEIDLMSQTFQIEEGSYPTNYEAYKLVNPVATLYPKKNYIPDLVSFPNTNDKTKLVYENENRLIMNATALTDYVNIQFPAKKSQQFTLWATELNENARVAIREVKADGTKTFLTNLTQIYMSHTFTASSSVDKIEIECTVKTIGKCIFDKVQLEEGSKTTFERYQLTNLRSV